MSGNTRESLELQLQQLMTWAKQQQLRTEQLDPTKDLAGATSAIPVVEPIPVYNKGAGDEIIQSNIGAKIMILAPLVRGKKGEHLAIYEDLKKEGFVRVKINGLVLPIEEFPSLNKNQKHNISAVIDRLVIKDDEDNRLLSLIHI